MIRTTRAARFVVEAAVTLAALALALWAARADLGWFEHHVVPAYCVAAGPTWPLHAARAAGLGLALLLVVVVRPRLGRAAGRELAITTTLTLPALALAFVCGELMLRRVQWDDHGAHEQRDLPAAHADPRLGWTFAPSQTRTVTKDGRTFTYAVDALGDRAARADAVADPDAPTLVVAGESFAFGYELDWDDTFAARAGRALGLQVVNAAVPAYGNDQVYRRLLDTLPRLRRPELVVFLFLPRQIRRNLSPVRPHLVLDDGRLVPAPAASGLAALRLVRLVTDEPYHGDAPLEVTRALLVASADAVRARGARPLFVVTNYRAACPAGADGTLRALLAGLPTVRVDLGPDDVFGADDPHPNPRGAAKIADAIVAASRAAGHAAE